MTEPETNVNMMPCEIHLLNGMTFVVPGIGGWQYTEPGVFASGHWFGSADDSDILIPYDRIDYYELDFEALRKHINENLES